MRRRWERIDCDLWRHATGATVHAITSKKPHRGVMAPRYYRAMYFATRAEACDSLREAMEIAESMVAGRESAA